MEQIDEIAKHLLNLPVSEKNTSFLIYVNNDLWGLVENLKVAKNICEKIAKNIQDSLTTSKPHYSIELDINDNVYTLNCISQGWIYNGTRVHTVRYEPINKIVPNPVNLKYGFDYIISNDLNNTPPNRPPTPTPKNKIPKAPPIPKTKKRPRMAPRYRKTYFQP